MDSMTLIVHKTIEHGNMMSCQCAAVTDGRESPYCVASFNQMGRVVSDSIVFFIFIILSTLKSWEKGLVVLSVVMSVHKTDQEKN